MLGRYFGLRGMNEITYMRFELFGFGFFGPKYGSLNGLKFYVTRIPFDKTNKLSLLNVKARPIQYQYSKVAGDPSDMILCPVRFFDFFFSKCHPKSTRFFGKIATEKQRAKFKKEGLGDIWFKEAHAGNSNSVVGINNIRTFGKKVAELAGFDSWEKCTNHGTRAYALTKMIENGAPLEDRMIFMRHSSANSQQPYARPSMKREVNKQVALRADASKEVPKLVTKGVNGFQMGGGPSSLVTETSIASAPPTVDLTEWEEFQRFKAMKAGQCPSVAAVAPAPAAVAPAPVPTPVSAPLLALTPPSMVDLNQLSFPSMMNPMSAMMNPMMGMGMNMGMMNPMMSMMGMGMMNPMAGMTNPIAMGVAMGMQLANQQNGNTAAGNNINIVGEQPLNPNNRIL